MRLLILLLAFACLPVSAKTATLQGTTSNTCAFSSTFVNGGGDLTVTCVSAPQPPAPPAPPPTCTSAPLQADTLHDAGFVNHLTGASGFVKVFNLPISITGVGVLGLYSSPASPKIGPTLTEISVSRCRGDFTDNGDGCYQASSALDGTQINQEWANKYTTRYPDQASFVKRHRCLVSGPGPWYVNVRMSYPANACPGRSQCGWDPIWKRGSAL